MLDSNKNGLGFFFFFFFFGETKWFSVKTNNLPKDQIF